MDFDRELLLAFEGKKCDVDVVLFHADGVHEGL